MFLIRIVNTRTIIHILNRINLMNINNIYIYDTHTHIYIFLIYIYSLYIYSLYIYILESLETLTIDLIL
jgi:hypothetical protein